MRIKEDEIRPEKIPNNIPNFNPTKNRPKL